MKTAKFFFAALLLSGSVVATYTPVSASEIPGLLFKEGIWFPTAFVGWRLWH